MNIAIKVVNLTLGLSLFDTILSLFDTQEMDTSHLDLLGLALELNWTRKLYNKALLMHGCKRTHSVGSWQWIEADRGLDQIAEWISRNTTWLNVLPIGIYTPNITLVVDVLESVIHRLLQWEQTLLCRPYRAWHDYQHGRQNNVSEDEDYDELLSDEGGTSHSSYDPPTYDSDDDDFSMPASPLVPAEDDQGEESYDDPEEDDDQEQSDEDCRPHNIDPQYLDRPS